MKVFWWKGTGYSINIHSCDHRLMEMMIIKVSWEKKKIQVTVLFILCFYNTMHMLCILSCSYVISDDIGQSFRNYSLGHYTVLCFPWTGLCAAPVTMEHFSTTWKINLMSRLNRKFSISEAITNADDLLCVRSSFDNKNNLSIRDTC